MIYTAKFKENSKILPYTANMPTIPEIGQALAQRRRLLNLKQGQVAALSGLSQSFLSRLEKGQLSEFGARKLMTLLAVRGLELTFTEVGAVGTLDELRRERGGA
jgi:HTH-type transcriptional regulator/antitoxin HipB